MDHSSNRGRIDMHLVQLRTPSTTCVTLPATSLAVLNKQNSAISSDTAFAAMLNLDSSSAASQHGLPKQAVAKQTSTLEDHDGWQGSSSQQQRYHQQQQQTPRAPPSSGSTEYASAACPAIIDMGQVSRTPACCEVTGMTAPKVAVVESEPDEQQAFDLSSVDLAEQQRLVERAEQLQRMKRAREQLAAAKHVKKRRSAGGQPLPGKMCL